MSFYKYMSASTAEIVLKNRSLRWSSLELFNDVEEGKFIPFTNEDFRRDFKVYNDFLMECAKGRLFCNYNNFSEQTVMMIEIHKMILKSNRSPCGIENLPHALNDMENVHLECAARAFIKLSRVLCLTKRFDNKLMWAHYADESRGCVMEFDGVYKAPPRNLRFGGVNYQPNEKSKVTPLSMFLYG